MHVLMVGPTPPWAPNPYVVELGRELGALPELELTVAPAASPYPSWFGPRTQIAAEWPPDAPFEPGRPVRWHAPWDWVRLGLGHWDIVHLQWWNYALLPEFWVIAGLARRRGASIIVTAHNAEPHETTRLRRWANGRGPHLADHLIVHTPRTERVLVRGGESADRISIVPHGFPGPIVIPAAERAAARAKLGIDDSEEVWLHFGAIRPYKRTHEVLRKFAGCPTGHLIVAGKPWGDYGARVPALAEELGIGDRTTLDLRTIDEPTKHQYYAAADVAIISQSGMDAASGAAAEAHSYGLAVDRWEAEATDYVPWRDAAAATADVYRSVLTDRRNGGPGR